MIGQQVREFEILSELGAGGNGVVYRAHDSSVNRDVAVKVVLPQHTKNADFKQRFETEAHLVAQLEHPHIVPLYSYWQDDGGAFLVMRYIRGGSLRALMAHQGALPLRRTVRILEQISDALDVAHSQGVVHRDLKPENILIDERGNAYLTDFGIAKQIDNPSNITEADAIVGTWAYLSPEQVQSHDVTPQSDIYALGILFYEMLAGEHPFKDTPITMLIVKHLQEDLPDVSEKRPDLPSMLDSVIARATAKDIADRYESTLDFINAVKNIVDTGHVSEQPAAIDTTPKRRKASTVEQRNRYAMLQNVQSFWVEGVLENSLHNAVMIDLGMKYESGAVDNPWNTVLRTPSGEETILPDMSPIEVFDRLNGKLLILGDPGGGKTTMLLELTRTLLARADADDEHPIPVVFNLSSWGEKQLPLEEWLSDELSNRYHVPKQYAEKWVSEDALLLLLDGLDEVPESHRNACVSTINAYRSNHGFVDMVVCSRILDYEKLTGQLSLNGAIVIQHLTDVQIKSYLDSFGTESAALRELIRLDEQVAELARSPLMLSIMMLAYRGVSTQVQAEEMDIESQRKQLFEIYIQRMFDRRGTNQAYSREDTLQYLKWLATEMQEHAQSLFHIEDLQPTWMNSLEKVKAFPSTIRMFSSVFMALCFMITGFSWYFATNRSTIFIPIGYTIAGAVYGFLFAHPWVLGDNNLKRNLSSAFIGTLIGISLGVGAGFVHNDWRIGLFFIFFYSGGMGLSAIPYHLKWVKRFRTSPDEIVFLERVQYSTSNLDYVSFIFAAPIQMIVPIVFALGLFPDETTLVPMKVLIALLFGISSVVGFNLYMDGFVAADLGLRLRPNEGLFATIQTMLKFGITTVVIVFFWAPAMVLVGVNWTSALLVWCAVAFHHGSDTLLSHGGVPLIQHAYLRYQLQKENVIPKNYANFLDYASQLILLRKVGGGYIFIHRYLLEHFATRTD